MTAPGEGVGLGRLTVGTLDVGLRRGTSDDLPALVAMLADDELGRSREVVDGDLAPYRDAFATIDADPAHLLVVAVAMEEIIGTLQLSVVPGLARRGALRGQLEAVRVAQRRPPLLRAAGLPCVARGFQARAIALLG